ncbi:MAG: diguanylate cyclase [Myxococcales bacterium]
MTAPLIAHLAPPVASACKVLSRAVFGTVHSGTLAWPTLSATAGIPFGPIFLGFGVAFQLLLLVAVFLLVLRHARTMEQLRRIGDAASALARGDRHARARISEGPLARFSQLFDDMATLLTTELRSLKETQKEIEQLIATDRLTGVGNRRLFEQQADTECARAKRYGIPVSLILFDVDHFKTINDTYGHQVGDAVLITLTRRVSSRLRDTDALARWGGEEFAILAPCTTTAGAEVLAEKVRAAVDGEDFDVVGKVTVSLGIAQLLPGDTPARWIARADNRLYDAKQAGRNRLMSSREAEQDSRPMILVWGEQFLVHQSIVDAQHAEIFRLANELILSPKEAPKEHVLQRFDTLFDYVAKHFLAEEQVLLDHGCPGNAIEAHSQLHHGVLAQASALRRRITQGLASTTEVGDFMLRRISVGHILGADLPLFSTLVTSATVTLQEPRRSSLPGRLKNAVAK